MLSWSHRRLVVFSFSLVLSIFFSLFLLPFCSAPCFSNAPSSHCISAHTLGTLAWFLCGLCRLSWTCAPPLSYFTDSYHLLVFLQLSTLHPISYLTYRVHKPSTLFSVFFPCLPLFLLPCLMWMILSLIIPSVRDAALVCGETAVLCQ